MSTSVQREDTIFYDGHCGLCHRGVKFVLKHDRTGSAFRFAPLHGATFQLRVPVHQRVNLPDTMIVQIPDGTLLMRSGAWVHILRQLGGGWEIMAALVRLIPRPVRDGVYDLTARIRHRIFRRPGDQCPTIEPELRARFDP